MNKETKKQKTVGKVSVSKDELLSLVASKLNGRILFPESVERARTFVRRLNESKS